MSVLYIVWQHNIYEWACYEKERRNASTQIQFYRKQILQITLLLGSLSLCSPCYGHFNDFVIRALVIYALWAEIHLAKKYNGMAEIRIRGWQIKLFWWLWACMALHHNISSAVARGAAKAIGRKRWSVRN